MAWEHGIPVISQYPQPHVLARRLMWNLFPKLVTSYWKSPASSGKHCLDFEMLTSSNFLISGHSSSDLLRNNLLLRTILRMTAFLIFSSISMIGMDLHCRIELLKLSEILLVVSSDLGHVEMYALQNLCTPIASKSYAACAFTSFIWDMICWNCGRVVQFTAFQNRLLNVVVECPLFFQFAYIYVGHNFYALHSVEETILHSLAPAQFHKATIYYFVSVQKISTWRTSQWRTFCWSLKIVQLLPHDMPKFIANSVMNHLHEFSFSPSTIAQAIGYILLFPSLPTMLNSWPLTIVFRKQHRDRWLAYCWKCGLSQSL